MKTFTQIELLIEERNRFEQTSKVMLQHNMASNSDAGAAFFITNLKNRQRVEHQLSAYPFTWIMNVEYIMSMRKSFALMVLLLTSIACNAQHAYHALEVSYITLQAADVITTYKGIQAGAYEANPFASKLISNHMLIPAKVVGTTLFLGSCRLIRKENPKLAMWYLAAGNLVYSAVVFNNYQVTLSMKI